MISWKPEMVTAAFELPMWAAIMREWLQRLYVVVLHTIGYLESLGSSQSGCSHRGELESLLLASGLLIAGQTKHLTTRPMSVAVVIEHAQGPGIFLTALDEY